MAGTRNNHHVAHIHEHEDAERQFLIHPNDNDVFVRTGREVIESCRLGISIDLWLTEFMAMLEKVRDWSKSRDGIKSCYCFPMGPRVSFFFSPDSDQFDFGLADELTGLAADLLKQFNVGMIETHQVPFDELDRFIDLQSARLVHGSKFEPHHAVEA